MKRTASCACGKLTIAAVGEPAVTALCGCLQCQKRTGSAFSAHAFYPNEAIEIEGEHIAFARTSDAGREVTFYFCPTCGSTLFWKAQARPMLTGVAAGAFADPAFPPPQSAIWMEAKPTWTPLPAGIPIYARGTPSPTTSA